MSIAPKVRDHLNRTGVEYSIVHHPKTFSSLASAHSAHVAAKEVAKAIIVHDGEKYRMCLIPASHKLVLQWLNETMHGDYRLVSEDEIGDIFEDCEVGAIPALGQLYGLPVTWDRSLGKLDDLYFEAGDHKDLVHVNHAGFMQLLGLQDDDNISCPIEQFDFSSALMH